MTYSKDDFFTPPPVEYSDISIDPNSGGVKADGDKPRFDLLPSKPLQDIVAILTYGASKYDDHNWRLGMKWSRHYAAAMRHLWAWWGGENVDPETSMSHLAHAACCIIFLMEYEYTRRDFDDRSQ